jgi:ATP-dependent helicase/nuclease subunit B
MTETLLLDLDEQTPTAERIFLGWDRPALPAAAEVLAERYARGGDLRLDGATLVLPGARAGRRLKELLLSEAEARGLRLVPPRVITLGTLPELLYEAERPVAAPAVVVRVWARALQALAPERLRRLVACAPEPGDLCGWVRLARTIQSLHTEVGGAGHRFRDVVECCADEMLLHNDAERWEALAEAETLFEAALARLGWSDAGLARIDALAAGRVALDGEIWLVGVVEMPNVVREMLAAPRRGGSVRAVVHAPEAEASGFDALGCLRAEAWTRRPVPLSDEQIMVRGRPTEQAAEVVGVLSALGGRFAADEIVVAVPDEELVPYLEQRLAAADVPVHSAAGTPAERTPVVRLLGACADYLDGARYDACAALARHPDLHRWLRRVEDTTPGRTLNAVDGWLEALDVYFAECLPARFDAVSASGELRGSDIVAAFCGALDDDRRLGRLKKDPRRLADWMPELLKLLAEVYGEHALDRGDPSERRLLAALAHLRSAVAELYRIPAELDEPCDAPTAIRLLVEELRGAAIPPEPDRAAVELLGWLEMRLDDAPVAVVTGFNEPFLPESLNAHAFLPNTLRTRIGLVDNTRRYARDAYELTALLHSREQVRVIAGRRTAGGDPLRPSRLMFAVEGRALAERVKRFYGEAERDASATEPAAAPRDAAPAGAHEPLPFILPPEPEIRAPAPITKVRVTEFKALLRDPYGYALERVLGLQSLDDRARELDGMSFGNVAHKVLERFAGGSGDWKETDEKRVRRRLDDILDALVSARYGSRGLPAVRVQVEQLRARLRAYARWHAQWIGDGWEIVGVERQPVDVPFGCDEGTIYLRGRIDRIDHHPERGEWAVFDYKTGDRGDSPDATHRSGKRNPQWVDLQLPLYRHLLPEVRDEHGDRIIPAGAEASVRLGYILLPRALERVGSSFGEWTDEMLAEADDRARDVASLLLRNVFTFERQRAGSYRDTPLAPVVGVGYLESAATAAEEEEA